MFLPIGVAVAVQHPPTAGACAIAAGLLASAVPHLADLFALRHVPARAFGLFMGANPVLAAWSAGSVSSEPGRAKGGEHRRHRRRRLAEHPHVPEMT